MRGQEGSTSARRAPRRRRKRAGRPRRWGCPWTVGHAGVCRSCQLSMTLVSSATFQSGVAASRGGRPARSAFISRSRARAQREHIHRADRHVQDLRGVLVGQLSTQTSSSTSRCSGGSARRQRSRSRTSSPSDWVARTGTSGSSSTGVSSACRRLAQAVDEMVVHDAEHPCAQLAAPLPARVAAPGASSVSWTRSSARCGSPARAHSVAGWECRRGSRLRLRRAWIGGRGGIRAWPRATRP